MGNVPLTIALSDYDHFRDVFTGKVRAEGIDITHIDLPVEDALKLVISMGLVFPEETGPVKVIGGTVDEEVAQKLLEPPVAKPKRQRAAKKAASKSKASEEPALTPPK